MQLPTEAERLRIYLGESDRHQGRPLVQVLVEKARRDGVAGATVLRGEMGFGAHSRLHTAHVLRLSEDLPLVIEIVDTADRIQSFLRDIDGLLTEGLVTLDPVRVIAYRHGTQEPR